MPLRCFSYVARAAVVLLLSLASSVAPAADKPDEPDTELTVLPFAGGNSDVGWGGGYIASIARVAPGYAPYLMRLESAGTVTFRPRSGAEKELEIPYIDDYVLLEFPHAIAQRVRLQIRISYTREQALKYYGLGNDSKIPDGMDPLDEVFAYEWQHPTLLFTNEYREAALRVSWGFSYVHNSFDIPEESKLAEDLANGPERVRRALRGAETHGSPRFTAGIGLDTRDDEVSPSRGTYDTARIDFSPGSLGGDSPGGATERWERLNVSLRGYAPLAGRRLVFAARVLGDFLFGAAPFYEMARFDETYALGGVKGVRGVPGQRYYGKVKAFANAELRSELFSFDLFGDERRLGLAAFADAGRVWADYRDDPELDGGGLGLKYGLGGGIRLMSGKSFVLRCDVAWSPDAHPIAGYLISGHPF
jgi:hypothetical protein